MDLLEELRVVLKEYSTEVEGIESVFISTLDGNMVLEYNTNQNSSEHLTPIAGSMLGLADSLSDMINKQNLHENITIMDDNILGFFKIYDKEDTLFLGVVCDRIINLARMIHGAKQKTKKINEILDQVT